MNTYSARVLDAWAPSLLTRAIRVEKPPQVAFAASQAARLILRDDLARPISIASGPARPYLDFAVQRSDSEFKRAFLALAPGDTVRVTAPRGHFLLERSRPVVMVAAGIGITPFRSMLEAVADEHATLSGALVHATRGPLDVPFRDEIDAHARRSGLRLLRRNGPLDDRSLRALAAEIAAPIWYVAGPVEDVKYVRGLLEAMGVERDDVRLEAFRYPGSLAAPSLPPGPPGWDQVYRSNSGERMPWYYRELDPDVARTIDAYRLRGRAVDVGTGPGTQAIALAERGFDTTGTDISPAAVEAARTRDTKGRVRFVVDDVLASRLDERFDLVFDRGCFHVLPAARRADYVRAIAARLAPGGMLLLKCFADDQPGEGGPSRFSPDDVRQIFGGMFDVLEITRTIYHGTLEPPPRALFCVLRAREVPS